jgi:hypothetical protein
MKILPIYVERLAAALLARFPNEIYPFEDQDIFLARFINATLYNPYRWGKCDWFFDYARACARDRRGQKEMLAIVAAGGTT